MVQRGGREQAVDHRQGPALFGSRSGQGAPSFRDGVADGQNAVLKSKTQIEGEPGLQPAAVFGTHKAEPTAKEMKKGMLEMMRQQPAGTAAAD